MSRSKIIFDNKTYTRKRLIKNFKKYWQLYLFLFPAVVYLIVFDTLPMYGLQIAFKDYSVKKGIWGSEWVGFKHFKRLFTYPGFPQLLKNTLRISLYSLSTFPCAIIFALMLNEVRNAKFKKAVQMIAYVPHFLSTVIVCSMIVMFFNLNYGVINTIVEFFGGEAQDWLAKPEIFTDIYVWSGVWQGIGWGSILYTAALSSVSSELIEAAIIDGANRMQIIWHINIPHILPTVTIMLILNCGSILSVGYEKIFLLQNDLNLSLSQVISTYVYRIGIMGGQFSYSGAIGMFNTVVNLTLLSIVNFVAKKLTNTGIW